MVRALALLFLCQLIGETTVRGLHLPVPGPVVGLVLLALGLIIGARYGGPTSATIGDSILGKTAGGLLGVLGILFVPAGVGVIRHLTVLQQHGVALLAALVGSTVITLVVTVWIFILVSRWINRERAE